MSKPMSRERLAEIRAHDASVGRWTGGPDEKYWLVIERRELLAEVDRLRAERDALQSRVDKIEALFAGGPDTPCRTTWSDGPFKTRIECVEVPMEDLRAALSDAPQRDWRGLRAAIVTLREAAEQWQAKSGSGLRWTAEGVHDWLVANAAGADQ